jgi:hypothetical protein
VKTLNEILSGFLASDVEIVLSKSQLGLLLLVYHRLYASESQQQDVSDSDLANFFQLIDRLESRDPSGVQARGRAAISALQKSGAIVRSDCGGLPRALKQINRRTLTAWLRRHSKVSPRVLPKAFADVEVTVDEMTRMRLPPRSTLKLKSGESIDCSLLTGIFGEVAIPERAWSRIERIEMPQSKLVFTIENKGAFIDFPQVATATLVFLPGDNISALHEIVSRTHAQPILHFGDLDAEGIRIFEAMLADGVTVEHFVPSYAEEFILTHAQDSDVPWPTRDYSSLHPVVSRLAAQGLWLEQEALVLDHRFEGEIRSVIERITNGTGYATR